MEPDSPHSPSWLHLEKPPKHRHEWSRSRRYDATFRHWWGKAALRPGSRWMWTSATIHQSDWMRDIPAVFETDLVIYQYLHRVVSPLYEDQLVGLTRNRVGERCAHSRGRVGLEPHAHGEGVHLRQTLLHFGVHVVGSQRESELEFIQRPVFSLTCAEEAESSYFTLNTDASWPTRTPRGFCIGIIHYTTNPQSWRSRFALISLDESMAGLPASSTFAFVL